MDIGLKIGQYLKDQGIKQTFISDRTGLSPTVVSYVCSGRSKKVDAITYYKICKALGVDMLTFIADGDSEI